MNLSGVKKGNYYITRGFNTAANEASDGTWIGGWDKEYLIAIPKESVARWKLFLHHDTDDVWLEAKLAEIPDVEAIEVATETRYGRRIMVRAVSLSLKFLIMRAVLSKKMLKFTTVL